MVRAARFLTKVASPFHVGSGRPSSVYFFTPTAHPCIPYPRTVLSFTWRCLRFSAGDIPGFSSTNQHGSNGWETGT